MMEDTDAMKATRAIEALRDRIRDFLLSLPPEGQLEVAAILHLELDKWLHYVNTTGTWRRDQ